MRLVAFRVPEERHEAATKVLDEHGFGYALTPGSGAQQGSTLVHAIVPVDAVEHLLDDLREEGLGLEDYLVSIDAEFAGFEHVDEVQNEWSKTPNRLAPAALRSKAKDLRRNTRSFVWMMVLSAVVAAAGLLLGSPAVVVGSMVIAPIVSPVLTASVGVVRNDRDMLVESLHQQALGLGVAIGTAALFTLLARWLGVIPGALAIEQMRLISLRISPSLLALAIGLSAGAAGAFGLATKGQVTIVGVMIAAALIPTAAAVGIGVAWGNLPVALGAAVLLALSMVTINAGAASMLFYLAYRADEVDEPILSFDSARQATVVVATLVITVAALLAVGILVTQQGSFERSVNEAITGVLEEDAYADLGVEDITVAYRAPGVMEPTVVTVDIAHRAGTQHRGLAEDLEEAIREATGEDVLVQVHLVTYEASA